MTQGWAALGKPDFATCGQIFYRLPKEVRECLNRSEERTLVCGLFQIWRQSYHSGRNTGYAQVSAQHIGSKFGRSRSTVQRALKKLIALQLVTTIRRRWQSNGKWKCNLWAAGSRMTAILHSISPGKLRSTPCSKTAPQEVENGYKSEKAAPLAAPPLLSEERNEELWLKESAGSAKQMEATFFSLIRTAKASVKGALFGEP